VIVRYDTIVDVKVDIWIRLIRLPPFRKVWAERPARQIMRVLIVEDELLIAIDVEDLVRSLNHEVVGPVASLRQAKEAAARTDVALVDVRLADGPTGPLVAEHLNREHGVTVVFTTGNPEAVRDSRYAIGVVQKPYRLEELAEVISFAIAHRQGSVLTAPKGLALLPGAA